MFNRLRAAFEPSPVRKEGSAAVFFPDPLMKEDSELDKEDSDLSKEDSDLDKEDSNLKEFSQVRVFGVEGLVVAGQFSMVDLRNKADLWLVVRNTQGQYRSCTGEKAVVVMSTTRSKKSTQGPSSAAVPQKEGVVVKRVSRSVTQHLPKPRTGFDQLVQPLIELVAKYSADLGSGIDVERMRSSLAAYQSLANEYQAARNHLASVESTRSFQVSTSWAAFLFIYDRLRSVARGNADLAADIEPFETFMKVGPRKSRKASTPTTPTTPA